MRLAGGVLLLAFPVMAQVTTPATSFEPLPRGAFSIEAEVSLLDADAFHRNDASLEIPGTLRFVTATARVAYAPSLRIAFGAELPYRIVEYRPELGEGSLRSAGLAGAGVFLDLNHALFRYDALLRFGYFRAADESDPVLAVSDGVDRYWLAYAVSRRSDRLLGGVRVEGAFGPARPPEEDPYGSGSLLLTFGRSLPREIDLLLLGRAGLASESREEGTFFDTESGYKVDAGLMLQWRAQKALRFRLSVTHPLIVRDGLETTRLTVSVVRTSEGR